MLYAATIFTSAFLLFAIQPILAKAILPWFGGTAAVWITCMVFFQTLLLGGYLYAHLTIRYVPARFQGRLHAGLLTLALLQLPVSPDARWKPAAGDDPTARIVLLLAATVGLAYLLLSATGPLLQAWYSRETGQSFPHRLYALSNVGSMLALFAYPVAIEPGLSLKGQTATWSGGFVLFAILCGAVALRRKRAATVESAADEAGELSYKPAAWWLVLSISSSALLVAVTNHLCQNVAAVPFLWILPLALYLISFIVTFDQPGWYRHKLWIWLHAAALAAMGYGLLMIEGTGSLILQIPLFATAMLVCCIFLHGELVSRRPAARHLTLFYLMISLGGALGGALVATGAPRWLPGTFELPIVMAACGAAALFMIYGRNWKTDVAWVAIMIALVLCARVWIGSLSANSRLLTRNFYGSLRVIDRDSTRMQVHGVVKHGLQYQDEKLRREPTSYYGLKSGAAVAFRNMRNSPIRVGVIGLGAGTLAAYCEPGDLFRFYEINPEVIRQAREEFTFLKDCPAKVDIVEGDARLSLEREQPQQFDVLVVDAFSGDSVPVHLLTLQAFELYFRHVRPDGVLALHISNVYMDLAPVVFRLGDSMQKQTFLLNVERDESRHVEPSTWVLVTSNQKFLSRAGLANANRPAREAPLWTDDFSNQWSILK
jgi:SAM-dependent methyltransferase